MLAFGAVELSKHSFHLFRWIFLFLFLFILSIHACSTTTQTTFQSLQVSSGVEKITGITIIKYPGNKAAFKFITSDGIVIIADPFEIHEYINPDVVTVSHNHPDHNDLSDMYGVYKLMNKADKAIYRGITITGIADQNAEKSATIINIIFVYDFNGIRIAHFASQSNIPTEEMYSQIGTVDILLVQCSDDPSRLSPEKVVTICKRLHPKIVVPEHGTPHLLERSIAYFGGRAIYENSGKLTVQRADLDSINTPELIDMDTIPNQLIQSTP